MPAVIDRLGNLKRVSSDYVMQDGERLVGISMMLMDQLAGGPINIHDDRAADPYAISDEQRQAVADARNEMIDRMCNAWKGGPDQQVTPLLDGEHEDARAAAYSAMVNDITNRWRGGSR